MSAIRDAGILAGMEKGAIFGTLAAGAGLHVATNVGLKALAKTKAGKGIESALMAAGIRRGSAGKQLGHITSDVAHYAGSPEIMFSHEIGRMLGKEVGGMSRSGQMRVLKNIRKEVASSPHLRDAPLSRPIVGAVNRLLKGEKSLADLAPSVQEGAKRGLMSRAGSAALGAGAVAAEPHSAIHIGLNFARTQAAKSEMGARFMKNQLKAGLQGKKMNPVTSAATDVLLSPGALDERRFGEAMRKEMLRRGVKPKDIESRIGQVEELIDKAMGRGKGKGLSERVLAKAKAQKELAGRGATATQAQTGIAAAERIFDKAKAGAGTVDVRAALDKAKEAVKAEAKRRGLTQKQIEPMAISAVERALGRLPKAPRPTGTSAAP